MQKNFDILNAFICNSFKNGSKNVISFVKLNAVFLSLTFIAHKIISVSSQTNILGVTYSPNIISGFSLSVLLLGIFVHAPVEELLFRWGLKFTPLSFTLLILGFLTTIQNFFLSTNSIAKLDSKSTIFLFLTYVSIILIIWWCAIKKKLNIITFYEQNKKNIFYLSIVIFGYSHFTKFVMIEPVKAILLSPIIFLPYLIMGYFFGLIRLKFGILWSIVTHGLSNLILPLLDLII
jgi:hypothetical protein